MPTSTLWRRPSGTSEIRYCSPPRPDRDAIERLSPEPLPDPRTSAAPYNWAGYHNNYHTAQGLGLSFHQQDTTEAALATSQQLLVDQNVEVRIEHLRKTSAGGYNGGINGYANHDYYRVPSRKESNRHYGKSRTHARSGSNIDTLATVALATSPTFTNGSPSTPQSSWQANSYTNGYEYQSEERPSKRARSEKLPSPEWTRRESRPATSYIPTQPTQASMDEAELLVNFAQNFNRPALQIAPPSHYSHSSPSYTRLSASTTSSEGAPMPLDEIAPLRASPQDMLESEKSQHQTFMGNGSTVSPGVSGGQLWSIPEAEAMKPIEQNEHNEVPTSQIPFQSESREDQSSQRKEEFGTHQISRPESGSADAEIMVAEHAAAKKQRRVKPTVEATSCAACNLLQSIDARDDKDSSTLWISCNACKRWYHASCAGFKDKREAQDVDKFICADCEPIHGSTTYVRKSSRARTAIDYAGLNEGIVKSSTETAEHHYIQPIKDGKITFQPDEFARIRPELVTLEHFEKTGGMKRPMVIPACWNSRLGKRQPETLETAPYASGEASVSLDIRTDLAPSDEDNVEHEEVMDCDQDMLDMVMPRDLTVRKVSELVGPGERLDVIDVKSQSQGDKKWTLQKWADYYESSDEKVIRNVISLEVSQTKLGRLIRRPKIVRDLDLQDSVWPAELQAVGDYPKVQFYCLMSVADCYTDFHIDFGGSSVYYHILKGKKTFFFIPPEDKNLKAYEHWCNSDTQDTTFLGDVTGDCSRVDLSEGDTMLIPAGWIHSVWTPENSLVIGGNFLTRQNYEMQIKVATIERDTKVAQKFRYPNFQKIMWYTALKYLEEDPLPQEVLDDFLQNCDFVFLRANPGWHEFGDLANDKEPGNPDFNARFYSRKEIEGLPALRDFLWRTAKIASGIHVAGVSEGATRSVQRSIPKGVKDPLETCKLFAIWCAWKIGSVLAPEWTHPDGVSLAKLAEQQEKLKQPEVLRTPPERVSSRVASQMESARASQEAKTVAIKRSGSSAGYESDDAKKSRTTTKASGLGPKRVACDACRKRRIRCRHKDDGDVPAPVTPDLPRPRAFSNLSVDTAQPTLSQTDNGLLAPSQSENSYPAIDANGFAAPTLAQEALATMSLPEQDMTEDVSTPLVASSSKKGRSKACDECRKSKASDPSFKLFVWYSNFLQRRCIHDELGRVDPAKAAEPSKPRGSAIAKRPLRLSDEQGQSVIKRPKLENGVHNSEVETTLVEQAQSALAADLQDERNEQADFESLIDPALMMDTPSAPPRPQPFLGDAIQQLRAATDAMTRSTQDITASRNAGTEQWQVPLDAQIADVTGPPDNSADGNQLPDLPQAEVSSKPQPSLVNISSGASQTPARSLASPPDSLVQDADFSPTTMANGELTNSIETNGGGSESGRNPLHTPSSASRHSSRQPKQVDRYVPAAAFTLQKPASEDARYDRRASSSGLSALTSIDGKSRRSSNVSIRGRETPATVAGQKIKAETPNSENRHEDRGRSSIGDPDMDEESLKLIRALQQEDLGLRRRGARG